MDYKEFYKKNSKRFGRYKPIKESGENIGSKKPDFYEFVEKYSGKDKIALYLGCGSGELTKRISKLFKKVVGVDFMKEYIDTAKKEYSASNVEYIVADCKNIPFDSDKFDVVISSRGPMSSSQEFINESGRVVKTGGYLIEETIGEKDKLELKKIFQRGQNYPAKGKKIDSVKELLEHANIKIIESKYFTYKKIYRNIEDVIDLLEHAPIINNFNKVTDKEKLEEVKKRIDDKNGIVLSSHRLWWSGRKQ